MENSQVSVVLQPNSISLRVAKYLKERFPVAVAMVFSLLFSLSVGVYLYPSKNFKELLLSRIIVIVSLTLFLFLFRLRLSDELKDFSYDSSYHSNRPIQRGLLSLSEVKWILVLVLACEIFLQIFVGRAGALVFIGILIYSWLMFREFYLKRFLTSRLALTLFIHQLIFLGYVFYVATALLGHFYVPRSVADFALLTFLFSPPLLFELGRKLAHRQDEKGNITNDTYIYRWGFPKAFWLTFIVASMQAVSFYLIIAPVRRWLAVPLFFGLAVILFVYFTTPTRVSASAKYWTVGFAILAMLAFMFNKS